ncbi:MAG: hypothetical protein AAF682_01515 [Planctomycetota bacterium]
MTAPPRNAGPIGIADLLEAVSALRARDPGDVAAIGATLGFAIDVRRLRARREEASPSPATQPGSDLRPQPDAGAQATAAHQAPTAPGPQTEPRRREHDVLPMGGVERRTGPSWSVAVEGSGPTTGASAGTLVVRGGSVFRPDPVALLRPQWERAVLAAALATKALDGALDVRRLIEGVARCEVIDELPRTPRATLRRGLQLLIDRGPGMMPFARDQERLATAIERVAGRDRTRALTFVSCPSRGCTPRGGAPEEGWPAPAPGTPVVVCSDLGAARRRLPRLGARVAEWGDWIQRVRAAGCPLLAVTPYEEERPRALTRWMRVLTWDRDTSVATVRDEVGRWLEARR